MNTSNESDTNTSFSQHVYALVRQVPKGRVTTYKELAHALNTKAYRAVGSALKNNPDSPKTPCHRVIKSDRTIGGYFGHTKGPEVQQKKQLLEQEGVVFIGGKVNKEYIHEF